MQITIKHWWKKSKITWTDGEIYHVLVLEESILWKWLFYTKQSINSKQSLSNYQWYFSQNSVLYSSVAQLCWTLCNPMDCSTPGLPVHHQLPELVQTHAYWVNDAIQPSHPLSSSSPPTSIFPSIRVFSNESALCKRWPKYWSFSFSISPSTEYSGLISFRIDWFHLLAVQETLKSLLQHPSSKASIIQCSALFMVQLSHLYTFTGKKHSFYRWTFVGKVMSLLFNMLSRLVIAFLPRSDCFNFMASVTICSDLWTQEIKVCHCFHCFPIYLPWSHGTRWHDLHFLKVEF